VLALKLVSPPYCAVIAACTLTLNDEMVIVAMLPAPTLPDPMLVAPSKNVTVPDGLPAPGALAVTIAVKVTLWPNTDGFGAELTLVSVFALLTI